MTSSKNWAPEWRTTHKPEKLGTRDGFCAEFQHITGRQTRVYIKTSDLKEFGKVRQELEESFVERVLRAVLECYINEKGMSPKFIEAHALAQLRSLQSLFRGKQHR